MCQMCLAPTRRQTIQIIGSDPRQSDWKCEPNDFGERNGMAVRIRMKKMGRTHRPYYRVCAMDKRSPRDGRVIEELGTYDPMCPETDARVTLKADRIDYWLGVGAQPSDKVATLIKKYGTDGTHLDAQKAAIERLSKRKAVHAGTGTGQTSQEEERRSRRPKRNPLRKRHLPNKRPRKPAAEAASEESASNCIARRWCP